MNENSLVIIYGIHKFDYRRVLRIFIIEKDLDLMEMMEERWMYLSFFIPFVENFLSNVVVTERISNLKWRTLSSDTEYGTKSKIIVSSQRSELNFEASNCKVVRKTYKIREPNFYQITIINYDFIYYHFLISF